MTTHKNYERTLIISRPPYLLFSAFFIVAIWTFSVTAIAEANDYRLARNNVDQKFTKLTTTMPKPDILPENVVRIQLEALANNDTPYRNAGIEIAFRFASPANQQATGPLGRFIQLVRNPVYKPMIDHEIAKIGDLVVEGTRAMLPVYLTASDGKLVGYMFILSKQNGGPYDQCWMTDAVLRFKASSV